MSSSTLYILKKESDGIYTNIRSVDPILNKIYEEFCEAISSKDLIQCLRLLSVVDDSYLFLNQLIFICDSDCCQTNCLALNLCHFAVLNDCEEIIVELLQHGGDLSSKTVEVTISDKQKNFLEKDSVIDLIIRRFNEPVKYFKNLLDGYIENSDLGSSYEFKFDFSILHPSSKANKNYCCTSSGKSEHQMCVLNEILNSFNEVYSTECSFLQHPLIEVYLICKWRHYRRFFYILVAMHVLFVALLSSSVVLVESEYKRFLETKNNTELEFNLKDDDDNILPILKGMNILMLLVGFQLFCHAILQTCFIDLRRLIYEFEILSNLMTSFIGLIICIYGLIQPLNWYQLTNQFHIIHSLNTLITLPAWINLMLIIGRIPSLGCYSLMFATVMKNFLKVTVSCIFLIVGFAMTFSLVFPSSDYYRSPSSAILRTIVMMMGEFEYSEMFSKDTNAIAKFIFILFVISCSINLMNLTQAIAVNDVKILHEISQSIRLEKEIRFLYEFKSIFTQRIMTSNNILKKIKERLYDIGAIEKSITISKNNHQIISDQLLSKLIQSYKPTKSIWSRKIRYAKFHFKCIPNRFDS